MCIFSIIIPSYNTYPFLAKALESIFSQNASYEIIVLDDGSSDESIPYLTNLKLNGQISLFQFNGCGPNVLRNYGVSIALGRYILFLDSDDYFEDGALETLSKHTNCDLDIIEFGYNFIDNSTGRVIKSSNFSNCYYHGTSSFNASLGHVNFYGVCWNKCFRTDFLKLNKILFLPDRIHGRDLIFSMDTAFYSKYNLSLDEILYFSRVRGDSFSRSYSISNVFSALTNSELILSRYQNLDLIQRKLLKIFTIRYLFYVFIVSSFRLHEYAVFCKASLLLKKFANNNKLLCGPVGFRSNVIKLTLTIYPIFFLFAKLLTKFNKEPY